MVEIKKGKFFRFPKNSLLKGLELGEKSEKYTDLRLFEDENGRWWIYYSRNNRTGGFDTKSLAIKWFEQKGR